MNGLRWVRSQALRDLFRHGLGVRGRALHDAGVAEEEAWQAHEDNMAVWHSENSIHLLEAASSAREREEWHDGVHDWLLDAMRPRSAVTLAALCALATLPLWSLQKRPPPATGPPPALVELARAQGRAIVDLRDGLERYRATTERLRGSPPQCWPHAPRVHVGEGG